MMCDIRVTEDKTPFLPNTKCLLLLGEAALYEWIPESRNNTLNEVRGSVYYVNGIPAVASYYPQDAADIRGFEQSLNKESKEYAGEDSQEMDDDSEDFDSVKRHGRTKRANYAFWLRADTKKCKQIIHSGVPKETQEPTYKIYPSCDEVIAVLAHTKGEHLYFDMETDYEDQNMQCFAFALGDGPIYCVPTLDFNYHPAYSALPRLLQSLAISIRDNTIVAHNGAAFDFLVLAMKYRIPIRKCYDTMIAMHRCFPDIEKSLGHCTSYWTWERFHKDEDSKGYLTQQQMMARLKYCGKDVHTMRLVHKAIEKYARTIPGLKDSIDTAMSSVVPYLTTSLQGLRYDQSKLQVIQKENDRLMMQYMRMINMLIGENSMHEIRSVIKGKAKSFPGSNTQCCHYFHNLLGYPILHKVWCSSAKEVEADPTYAIATASFSLVFIVFTTIVGLN